MKANRNSKWNLSAGERRQVLLYVLIVVVAVVYAFYLGSHPHMRENGGVAVHQEGN